ncbi:MAG: DUF4345 family protein [Chitinophagaceae bacterium]|nr:DUF4345 family protein [Chitinophagaceae bacterium]
MTLALSIVFGVVALICFLGGINVVLKGAMGFLPKETPPQLILDNLFRFLGGIYLGGGFLFTYAALNVESIGDTPYFLGIMVGFSGLGRLYSRYKLGSAGAYFNIVTVVEILLGLSIVTLERLR